MVCKFVKLPHRRLRDDTICLMESRYQAYWHQRRSYDTLAVPCFALHGWMDTCFVQACERFGNISKF